MPARTDVLEKQLPGEPEHSRACLRMCTCVYASLFILVFIRLDPDYVHLGALACARVCTKVFINIRLGIGFY